MTTFKTRRQLEQLAEKEFDTTRASVRMEVVGVGLEEQDAWIQLPNIAPRSGSFMVAGSDVKDAMFAFAERYGVGRLEVSVWHSHYVNTDPSRADLENYPTWARRGLLFHTPTGTTSAYGRAGVLFSLSNDESTPLNESEVV